MSIWGVVETHVTSLSTSLALHPSLLIGGQHYRSDSDLFTRAKSGRQLGATLLQYLNTTEMRRRRVSPVGS